MLLLYLLGSLFIGQALSDLECADFTPHNWTSPYARLYMYEPASPNSDPDPPVPSTVPGYLSGSNPLQLVPKGNLGGLFRLRTCNSTSLSLSPQVYEVCPPPNRRRSIDRRGHPPGTFCDAGCYDYYNDNLQIIHNSTGHCLTWQVQNSTINPPIYKHVFTPCDPNPQDTYQIYGTARYETYYVDNDGESYGVCNWGVTFQIYPEINEARNGMANQVFGLDPNNKTVISADGLENYNVLVVAKHHDPLTTYQN